MSDPLPAFLRHLASRSVAPRTMTTYGAIVASFFAFLARAKETTLSATSSPSRADIEAFLARPCRDGQRRAASTRNQELAALRAFGEFAQRELDAKDNLAAGIPFVREPARDPAVLTAPEVRRMFAAADTKRRVWERARNLAILAVLTQDILRVHELVGLDAAQVDVLSRTLVAVKGKGGTMHDLPLNDATIGLLQSWLIERQRMAKEDERALFVSSRGTRLSIRAVQHLVLQLRRKVGSAKKITPHTFRHSGATLALELGADLSTVSGLLRHANLNTTRRYLHFVDGRKREAVDKLAVAIPAEILDALSPASPPANDVGTQAAPAANQVPVGVADPAPLLPNSQQKTYENSCGSPLDALHSLDAMDEAA